MKLGKLAPRRDPRTLRLARYLTAELPQPPDAVNWGGSVQSWPCYRNNEIGDCAVAGPAHLDQLWTADAGTEVIIPEPDVLAAYSAISGYRPGDDSTDTGCVLLDVLKYWRSTGIGGRRIDAFAAVDTARKVEVQQGIWLFGGLDIGLNLPNTANDQVGTLWDVISLNGDGAPGSWGGHCVCLTAYDLDGLTCITWGAEQRMTWDFFAAYADEAWAVICHDWIMEDGYAPCGFRLEQLQADLAAIR